MGIPRFVPSVISEQDRRLFYHPCFATRLGGVSGGKESQGWRDSSHTAMVRRGEIRVGEVADGNGDVSRKAFALPVDGGAACRTEMKRQHVSAFSCPHPGRRLTGEGDLLAAKARLIAAHGASAALALQAVAHGNARWFALNHKLKLPATAGGASGGHGRGSVAVDMGESIGRTSKRCTVDNEIAPAFPLPCIGFP